MFLLGNLATGIQHQRLGNVVKTVEYLLILGKSK